MGKRGPKPLTDGEKSAAGIVLVPAEIGPCPEHLCDDARAEFERLRLLVEQRVIGATDRAAFVRYCSEWALWLRLDRACQDADLTTQGENGERKNPLFDMRDKSSRTLLSLEDKLGLTPACRARLSVEPSEPQDSSAEEEYFA